MLALAAGARLAWINPTQYTALTLAIEPRRANVDAAIAYLGPAFKQQLGDLRGDLQSRRPGEDSRPRTTLFQRARKAPRAAACR